MTIYKYRIIYDGVPYAELTAPGLQEVYNIFAACCSAAGCPDMRQTYAEVIGDAYNFDGTVSEWYEAVKEGMVE
jgi:hypothetical protein